MDAPARVERRVDEVCAHLPALCERRHTQEGSSNPRPSHTCKALSLMPRHVCELHRYSAALKVAWDIRDESGLQLLLEMLCDCIGDDALQRMHESVPALLIEIGAYEDWASPMVRMVLANAAGVLLSRMARRQEQPQQSLAGVHVNEDEGA